MSIQSIASKYEDYLIGMRRHFHENPELSRREYETSKFVKAELDKIGVPWRPCGLETGILGEIKGAKPGKTILIRGDMDALPVEELTGAPYASKNPGVMHACGHDCHISMMLTATRILCEMRDELCGTVKLAYQPAEEEAVGAKAMIADGALDGVDACFSMHVWTGVSAGKVTIEPGPRMASADEFHIKVKGMGCHGAQPEQGVDAVIVTADIINNLQTIISREISPMDAAVITVGTIEAGQRWNVVAENSYMTGTTRCFSADVWDKFEERMRRVVESTAAAHRAEAELEYIRLVPPTINDENMVRVARNAAIKLMGEEGLISTPPTTVGEDFAYFMQKVPGAMIFLGTGSEELGAVWPNHSGHFCVDEAQLIKGAMLYVQVAMDFNAGE